MSGYTNPMFELSKLLFDKVETLSDLNGITNSEVLHKAIYRIEQLESELNEVKTELHKTAIDNAAHGYSLEVLSGQVGLPRDNESYSAIVEQFKQLEKELNEANKQLKTSRETCLVLSDELSELKRQKEEV